MDSRQREQFRKLGHVQSRRGVSAQELAMLRNTCDALLEEPVDDGGGSRHRIGLGRRRRFLAHRHVSFPDLENFLLEGSAAQFAAGMLGETCMLFNEQFVVKGAESGASFAWHQDGAYVGFAHRPYLSVWIALDDANAENGCLHVLPRNLDEDDYIDPHAWMESSRELTCRSVETGGVAIECRAGSMIAFSSLTPHRSGSNTTPRPRRAYLAQYSAEPIRDPSTGELKRFAKTASASRR